MTVLSTMNKLSIVGIIIIDVSHGAFGALSGSTWNRPNYVPSNAIGDNFWKPKGCIDCGNHGKQIKNQCWKCECDLGWQGQKCNEEIPCNTNFGQIVRYRYEGMNYDYKCECNDPKFYGGKDCSVLCYNGWHAGDDECVCIAGYKGVHCSVPCRHGTIEIIDDKEKCVCQDGYKGTFCQDVICPKSLRTEDGCRERVKCGYPRRISHGKETSEGECKCDEGWAGSLCTEKVECNNGGLFRPPMRLEWECIPCNHDGGRVSKHYGECICKPGWGGRDCSKECDKSSDKRRRLISIRPQFGSDCEDTDDHYETTPQEFSRLDKSSNEHFTHHSIESFWSQIKENCYNLLRNCYELYEGWTETIVDE